MAHDTIAAVTAADMKALADKFGEATKKLQDKDDELSRHAEKSFMQMEAKGKLLDETKALADKLLAEQTALTAAKDDLKARMLGVEQEITKRQPQGGLDAAKSIGARLVEDKEFLAWRGQGAHAARGKHRFSVNATLTSVTYPPAQPGVIPAERVESLPRLPQRLFVRDLLNIGRTAAPAITYVRQTGFTNNAAVISEGDTKPESTIAYDQVLEGVKTIAHWFKASKQILDDMPMLQTDVDRELRYGVKYAEEQEILFGDGTGMHLHGITGQATAYSHIGITVASMSKIDDIRIAMLQTQLARLPATGIVLHFTDWAAIELLKDGNGRYIWSDPRNLAGPSMWGLPIVPTEISTMQGKLLVGAFETAATLYDREEVNVEIATENDTDFIKNLITIRCEERVVLAVRRPSAFIYGSMTVTT